MTPVPNSCWKMEVKRGEDIHEDPWDFLEKELQNFQKVLKDLEAGKLKK